MVLHNWEAGVLTFALVFYEILSFMAYINVTAYLFWRGLRKRNVNVFLEVMQLVENGGYTGGLVCTNISEALFSF